MYSSSPHHHTHHQHCHPDIDLVCNSATQIRPSHSVFAVTADEKRVIIVVNNTTEILRHWILVAQQLPLWKATPSSILASMVHVSCIQHETHESQKPFKKRHYLYVNPSFGHILSNNLHNRRFSGQSWCNICRHDVFESTQGRNLFWSQSKSDQGKQY